MGREFEIKFASAPAQLAEIQADHGDFFRISMETTYYDAADGALSARRITLRRRCENGTFVCTVKTPQGVHGRGEWETECDNIEAAIPVLCKLGCPEDLVALTSRGITQVCGARFTRLAKELNANGCTLELALDQGLLSGGGKEQPLCEVELELKSGSEEAALAFARDFSARYDLIPEEKSKFQRALSLAKEA